jgi:adenosylcobinamide kinase/adenosylcobinamide-phosphate guanylyltransferase
MLVLVLGGTRSGKSEVGERLAPMLASRVVYLAPGQAWDDEMTERIARHRQRRDSTWTTVEETLQIPLVMRNHGGLGVCILFDGLGTWISNMLLAEVDEEHVMLEVQDLLVAVAEIEAAVVIVSDEVGLGVVPPSPLGRLFRDCLGCANQMVAAAADRALFVAAGIPIDLKALEVKL